MLVRKTLWLGAGLGVLLLFAGELGFAAGKTLVNIQITCPLTGDPEPVIRTAPGGQVRLQEVTCQESGMTINGVAAVKDDMLAAGFVESSGSLQASGYTIGNFADGKSQYLAVWKEQGSGTGLTIELRFERGTGVAQGIKGKVKIECTVPPPGSPEVCHGKGYYVLEP